MIAVERNGRISPISTFLQMMVPVIFLKHLILLTSELDSEKVDKDTFTAIVGGTVRGLIGYSYVMGSWADGPSKDQDKVRFNNQFCS